MNEVFAFHGEGQLQSLHSFRRGSDFGWGQQGGIFTDEFFSVVSSNCSPLSAPPTRNGSGYWPARQFREPLLHQDSARRVPSCPKNTQLYKQHTGGAVDHCPLINFITVQVCILQDPLAAANGLVHEGLDQLFKYGPAEHYLLAADKSVEMVIGREVLLGFFCLQMQGLRPCVVVLQLLLRKGPMTASSIRQWLCQNHRRLGRYPHWSPKLQKYHCWC